MPDSNKSSTRILSEGVRFFISNRFYNGEFTVISRDENGTCAVRSGEYEKGKRSGYFPMIFCFGGDALEAYIEAGDAELRGV